MITINYSTSVFVLPSSAVRECLEDASESQLKALLLLASDDAARSGYPENADRLAASVGLSRKAFDSAFDYWRQVGVFSLSSASASAVVNDASVADNAAAVSPEKNAALENASASKPVQTAAVQTSAVQTAQAPAQAVPVRTPDASRPQYSGEELDGLIGRRPELRLLIDAIQGVLGKLLSPAEINKIVELSDYLRLPDDFIVMLCSYCAELGKPSIHYIYKTAYGLHDDGITDTVKLDEHIRRAEQKRTMVAKLRTLLGFGDRALTPKENECFDRWLCEWSMPFDLIEHAYEVTINNLENHKLSLPYMNKVLENWYNAGYKTVADAVNALAEYRERTSGGQYSQNTKPGMQTSSFDTAEFFELALRRSANGEASSPTDKETTEKDGAQ